MSNPITIRLPSKYASSPNPDPPFTPPTLAFLHRTWSVTHSTLKMWRSARNVRITYGPLPSSSSSTSSSSSSPSRERVSDLVEYESLSGAGSLKRIAGVDTASSAGDTGVWDWRGSGLLFFVGSHWEVLGYGERAGPDGELVERWVVTWFAPTVFTAEGLDVYSDRKEGASEGLVEEVLAELGRVCKGQGKLGEMVERDMREVKIELPWKEA
ncbi:hypothetical protein NEMBOFW57_010095 [Staphylotrichum longicolle]|uniref:Uncharacterized protein n=1 Tax=Staphylotrichum longicolle TaxID=669026 RepID=A0AAD4HV94_9PEZI|nr:hypothetical protein NEMBOFW57_010095 [Staphylotrichum longicolle]